ncbi:DUF4403 family protein [Algoriphagus sp.]|uniref:DUF4403 family protein n=1 Tax=Algoriphagus sp. TaxID=1872435 RepID=UPI002612F3DF|nr:DUF4403 family protein [Algoriphagus sp.]
MKLLSATQLQKYIFLSILSSFLFLGCKSLDISNPGPLPDLPSPESEVNVPFVFPKETLHRLINSQIPNQLLTQDELEIGNGIEANLQLSRNGQIQTAALDSQHMTLQLPMKIQGEIGLSQSGLGSLFRGKVPLDNEFAPVFKINPEINPDWSLSVRDFELMELGGNLTLDVLGMKVDLSGMLERELKKWAAENLGEEKKIARLKPWVDLVWEQAGKPFQVSIQEQKVGFSIRPERVLFKEFFDADQNLNLWLGLQGQVQSHPGDAMPSRAFPLPHLGPNTNDNNQLEILLPSAISYQELDEILGKNLNGKSFRVDSKTLLTLKEVKSKAFGELMAMETDFAAERSNGKTVEGRLFVVGKPSFDQELQSLTFEDVNFKVISNQASANFGIALKKRKIIRQIEKMAVFPIGDLLQQSTEGIQDRLGLNTPIADLEIENLKIIPEGFYPTVTGLRIYVHASGNIGVNWKSLAH